LSNARCPKDAFKGGRTECFRALYECGEDEYLANLDITSLNSFVMSEKPMPTGKIKFHKGKKHA